MTCPAGHDPAPAHDSITLDAGYRCLAVDFDDGGLLFDVALSGPIIGASIRF
jgi:hypothetical protein